MCLVLNFYPCPCHHFTSTFFRWSIHFLAHAWSVTKDVAWRQPVVIASTQVEHSLDQLHAPAAPPNVYTAAGSECFFNPDPQCTGWPQIFTIASSLEKEKRHDLHVCRWCKRVEGASRTSVRQFMYRCNSSNTYLEIPEDTDKPSIKKTTTAPKVFRGAGYVMLRQQSHRQASW